MSRPHPHLRGALISDFGPSIIDNEIIHNFRLVENRFRGEREKFILMTADQWADLFRAHGIKGKLNDGKKCPLARWWNGRVPELPGQVAENAIQISEETQVPISAGMREFQRRFDALEYPDLVEV